MHLVCVFCGQVLVILRSQESCKWWLALLRIFVLVILLTDHRLLQVDHNEVLILIHKSLNWSDACHVVHTKVWLV